MSRARRSPCARWRAPSPRCCDSPTALRNRVPSSLFSVFGKVTPSPPDAARTTSRALASSSVFTPVSARTAMTETSWLVEPIQLSVERIEAHALPAEQRLDGHATCNKRERGAVLGREIGDVVGRRERAGARHVADDHRRIAGDEARQMARHETGIGVVEAARLMTGHRSSPSCRHRNPARRQADGSAQRRPRHATIAILSLARDMSYAPLVDSSISGPRARAPSRSPPAASHRRA